MLAELWPRIKSSLIAGHRLTLTVKREKRTNDQNAKLWACLTDISEQVEWHGIKLSAEDWKHLISASLKKQRIVPGIDGGFVALGQSTSGMTKEEFSDLLEVALAFGAEHGVRWTDEQ
ncbi:MAG: recombination protein NinB [Patescibacteria group bacterium]|nr:recombination protein NinB [Patescibacteria group bacterium]